MTAISKSETPRGFSFRNEMKFVFFLVRVCHRQKLSLRQILRVLDYAQSGWEEAKAISVALPQLCQDVFDHYIRNVRAYMLGHTHASDYSGNRSRLDERFMHEIECSPQFGINSAQAGRFRSEVMLVTTMWHAEHRDGTAAPYKVHEPLGRCVEDYVQRRLAA